MNDTGFTSMAGNLFGGILNYEMNKSFQERQFREQEKMQERAFQMNEQAVRNQAENMKLGLENAGLNPAIANGQGAPSVAAGTAASGSSQLSQIFSGLAELIAETKAPTEIEKTIAETGLIGKQEQKTEAETGLIGKQGQKTEAETQEIFKNITKIKADAEKAIAETKNITNINTMFESEQKFLKEHSAGIFSGYIGQLKATDVWKNLPNKTKDTLESIAEGEMEIDTGAMNALTKIIDTQGNLSERDKQILQNTKQMIVDYKQITDKKVMEALKNMPIKDQEKLTQEVKKIKEEVKNLRQTRRNLKQERIVLTKQGAMLESQARKTTTEREIEELNDMQYLIDKGRYEDAARLGSMRMANDLWDTGREGAKEAIGTYTNPILRTKGIKQSFKNFK